jgi:hypothetical protein
MKYTISVTCGSGSHSFSSQQKEPRFFSGGKTKIKWAMCPTLTPHLVETMYDCQDLLKVGTAYAIEAIKNLLQVPNLTSQLVRFFGAFGAVFAALTSSSRCFSRQAKESC